MDLAALRAYAAASQGVAPQASQTQPVDGAGFEAMVKDAIGSVEETVATAEQLTVQAATGQAELVDVVTAVAAAEVQLETVVAVRDQVIRAYQEILRMPI